MGTINLTLPVSGNTITAGLHATNYAAIQAAINGDIDAANIEDGSITNAKMASGNKTTRLDIDSGPPGSSVDGDIWIAEDVGAENSGVAWQFVYNSDSSSAFDWEFVGGGPLSHEILTSETRNNAAYGDLATAGPNVTVPRAGDYKVEFGVELQAPVSVADGVVAAVKRGAAAASDNDAIRYFAPSSASAQASSCARIILMAGLAASDVLKIQYKNNGGGNATFSRRYLHVTPLRVS